MKRVGCLFRELTSFSSLRRAAGQAARGKRYQDRVASFLVDVEKEVEMLQQELRQRRYQPGPYRSFEVHDPKRRAINAPVFRDRVLHHAVCGALEPVLERVAIADSFACRRGKGAHLAVARVQEFARHHPYFLKLDVARFYDSVDHDVLRRALRRLVKDADLLWLLDTIIDHSPEGLPTGKGMAIGNLTSQHFANLYLSRLDHYVKENLGVRAYARYMDDVILFGPTKDVLWQWQRQVESFMADELLLSL
jgi:retron-type reverse transcriptase